MNQKRFSQEELSLAKSVDLCAVASNLGYTVKRIGNYYTLKEMDSIRIYDRRSWFRWSKEHEIGENGGSQIDFLRVFAGIEMKEAVWWLLDFAGYRKLEEGEQKVILHAQAPKEKTQEKKPFLLPLHAAANKYLYQYLCNERAISKSVIDYFIKNGLIYEERMHHNIVFKGNRRDGKTVFASLRGVIDRGGEPFKCDVAGNDKNYGFNVWNSISKELVVFEGAIDMMSYMDVFQDFDSNKLALGMLSDAPLVTFLREYPQICSIKFCLDNDVPGRKATETLTQRYYELGYEVEDAPPPKPYKDYNQWLVETKKQMSSFYKEMPVINQGKSEKCL